MTGLSRRSDWPMEAARNRLRGAAASMPSGIIVLVDPILK
jgi:hypothetical protein